MCVLYYSVLFPSLWSSSTTFLSRQLGRFCTQHPFPFTKLPRPDGEVDTGNAAGKQRPSPPCDSWAAGEGRRGMFWDFSFLLRSSFPHFPSFWFTSNWKWNLWKMSLSPKSWPSMDLYGVELAACHSAKVSVQADSISQAGRKSKRQNVPVHHRTVFNVKKF